MTARGRSPGTSVNKVTTAPAPSRLRTYLLGFHPVGLSFALLFFVWSMTPSLLPRVWYLQGVATGISLATGYGVGCLTAWVVRKCGVQPEWADRTRRYGWWALAVAAAVLVPLFLVLGSWWQQVVRDLVLVPRAERSFYLGVLLVALVVALLLVALGRGLRAGTRALTRVGAKYAPLPVARLAALALMVLLVVTAVNGALYRGVLGLAERSAKVADQGTAEGVEQPSAPERSGSPASHESWDSLGLQGRTFVASGPTAAQIEGATGETALTPVRVYAGRDSADTIEGVADRVVAELRRTGGFDRAVLAVATTTGTGWINGNVAGALEYVNHGDTAIATMQYSFLPSPMAFLADRATPQVAGQALFEAVYKVWAKLPEADRPKLVVFGESLGAYGGMAAFASGADMVARLDGALLVGPPNFAQPWRRITADRDPGSPEWKPVIDGGENIRFASQPTDTDLPAPWGDPRIVFWQHPSDPITWWSFDLLLSRPDWLREPLGPGVDPGMRWLPFVTFWQVTMDMVFSTDVPSGFGHTYGPEAVDLWAQILQPEGWSGEDSRRVQEAMAGG